MRSSQLCKVWRSGPCSGRVLAWLAGGARRVHVEAPPLPVGISPARGEIAHYRFRQFSNLEIGESGDASISPLAGEMPTGRGGRLAPNLRILCPRAAKTRIDPAAQKNTSVANQHLVTFLKLFHPPPPIFLHTVPAALMGPDDHRHSGERAAYGGHGQRCSWRAETLSHVPPGLRALSKEGPHAPARAKSRFRACGEPHPLQVSSTRQDYTPWTSLKFQ